MIKILLNKVKFTKINKIKLLLHNKILPIQIREQN